MLERLRLNSTNPLFQFAVSVQNHPDYSSDRWLQNDLVRVLAPSLSDVAGDGLEDLATGLYYSDKAIGQLIEYFNDTAEPTVIIIFGDHMSKVGNSAYEIFEDSGLISKQSKSIEKQYITHRTPFVAWSNYYSINENLGVVAASQLLPIVFDRYDIRQPLWFDFLHEVYETSPGYSAGVVLHKDGTYSGEMSEREKEIYKKYNMLQYDYLYGKQWALEIFTD